MSTVTLPRKITPVLTFSGGISAAGLFVAWRPAPKEGKEAALDEFQLTFCGHGGTLHPITVANPWRLALQNSLGLAEKLGALPIVWSPDEKYDLVLIAHPSPDVAKLLFERLTKGEPINGPSGDIEWPIVSALEGSVKKGNLVFELPEEPEKFVPPGHSHFDGWVLYSHMPYAGLDAVKSQVRKLAFLLGELRFPTGIVKKIQPYPGSDTEHTGEFDEAIQASVHHFHKALEQGVAFQLSETAKGAIGPGVSQKETWSYLMGTDTAHVQPRQEEPGKPFVSDLEPGVVDERLANELLDWKSKGLIRKGRILASRSDGSRTLFAQPELWMALRSLEATCKALEVPYGIGLSNTSRILPSSGPGQVVSSYHKLGRAVDVDTAFAEPSSGFPVAFEVNRVPITDLKWQLFAHSRLDPFNTSVDLSAALTAAQEEVKNDFESILGKELPLSATTALVRLQNLHSKLLEFADAGTLAREFFREEVSRFQFQAGEKDGGNAQPPVTAPEDAQANAIAPDVKSWVNFSRLAFHLEFKSISAHEEKLGPVSTDLTDDSSFRMHHPGAKKGRLVKAIALDELAEGIRVLGELGSTTHVHKADGSFLIGLPTNKFNMDAIASWMRRPTDGPGLKAPPPGISYADFGVDMTIEWPFGDARARARLLLEEFLDSRSSIPVRVIHLGKGIAQSDRDKAISKNQSTTVGAVKNFLSGSTQVRKEKDSTIVVRPVFADEIVDDDPGTHSYRIIRMHKPEHLEWWHFELQPEQDGLFWHDFAEQLGLDPVVLEAKSPPNETDTPPDTPWTGGASMKKPQFATRRGSEPTNSPGKAEVS